MEKKTKSPEKKVEGPMPKKASSAYNFFMVEFT